MKKILSITVSLILLMSCIFTNFTVSADGGVVLSVTSQSATKGSTASISVNVTQNNGFSFLMITPNYDSDNLTLTNTENGNVCGSMTNGKNPNWNGNGENITATGTLVTFIFKINDNAVIKDYIVGVTIRQCYNALSETVECKATNGTIKVSCKTHSYGEYTKIDNNQHQRVCSACNHIEKSNHTWNGGTVTKQANCKEEGSKKFTCTACGAEKNEKIAKTNNHTWGKWETVKSPTCIEAGTQKRTCAICGKTETQAISALGHSMGNWVQSKAPTCTSKGEEKRSCSKCGHSETRAINALGHSFSNPKITKEPTCTESGIEIGKCTRCGQETTNTIKPTGHKFGAWEDVKIATCTEGGTQKRVCSKCKTEETRNTDALGHDFDNPTVVKEATISSTGLMEGKCKRCGEATQEVIPCTAKDDLTGISFETSEGVFSEGTQITTEEIKSDNANYGSVKNLLSEITGKFSAYNISASLNGTEVQPNGEVKVTFNIPDGFGNDVVLYAISEDGKSEQIEAAVSEDGKTISATISNFGTYAICKLGSDNSEDSSDVIDNIDSNNEEKSQNNKIWIIIAVIAVILIAGAVTTLILVKKKKSDNPDDSGMFL